MKDLNGNWWDSKQVATRNKEERQMANKALQFVNEVKTELKKVSWSTRDEIISSTTVVLISVALLAIFVGICDLIFSRTINLMIR